MNNMKTGLLLNERLILSETIFVEMVVWRLPQPLPGSSHQLKYRLALVVAGHSVLRYDNESGKGDHRHEGSEEKPYIFTSSQDLLKDFWNDVDNWRD